MSIVVNEDMLSLYGTECKACAEFYEFRAHVTSPPSKECASGRCPCVQINHASDLSDPEGDR
jgi:hypothetical protein